VAKSPAWRAVVEAALVAAVLGIALLAHVPPQVVDPVWAALALGFVNTGLAAGVVLAVRTRRTTSTSRPRAVAREAGLLVAGLVVIVPVMFSVSLVVHALRPSLEAISPWLAEGHVASATVIGGMGAAVASVSAIQAFVIVRPVVVLWPRWDRLRRSRLVWSITHGQLVAAFALAVAGGLVLLATFVLGQVGPFGPAEDTDLADPLVRPFVGFIAAVGGIVGVFVIAALVVLPIGALVSWAVLRPTTRRLDGLTQATGALRAGDLAVRVPVEGEDEVADLQADFNAMATDLERSIGELQAERDTVARLLSARRELLTAVSHELRTPVATLRAYLDASLEHWDGTPPATLRRDLEVMDREAVRLQRLIEDLFDLSRAEVENLPLSPAPLAVAPILERSVEATRQLSAGRARVELVLDVPGGLPLVLADEGRLEQIVRNLLANAVRHTPPGGVVRLSAEAADGMVAVAVEDTGEGMEPGELDRIWERFYRTDSARDRDHGGAGLGLALVKELTEAMGGRVEATSTPGTGSRFTVWLPTAATVLRQVDDGAATGR
jgi:signal transduction histidine kinase